MTAPDPGLCPVELTGPTLRLRGLEPDDAPRLLTLLADPEVSRFFLWVPPRDLDQARSYVEGLWQETALGGAYHFAVARRQDEAVLGVANLYHLNLRARQGEFGIWLGRQYWGQGVPQEVSRLLLAFGFETLGLEQVVFRVDAANHRALRAFRKLGAVDQGPVTLFSHQWEQPVEHRVLALTAAERRAGQP